MSEDTDQDLACAGIDIGKDVQQENMTPTPEMPMTRVCPKCGGVPHLTKPKLERRDYTCLSCQRKRNQLSKHKNFDHYRQYSREWKSAHPNSEKNRPKRPKYWECYRRQNSDKIQARSKIFWAIRIGKLRRLPCEDCGAKNSQAHHPDYSKPLEVIWLCQSHHGLRHLKVTV